MLVLLIRFTLLRYPLVYTILSLSNSLGLSAQLLHPLVKGGHICPYPDPGSFNGVYNLAPREEEKLISGVRGHYFPVFPDNKLLTNCPFKQSCLH